MNPDLSLDGDKQNFLWHEYKHDAAVAIEEVLKYQKEKEEKTDA